MNWYLFIPEIPWGHFNVKWSLHAEVNSDSFWIQALKYSHIKNMKNIILQIYTKIYIKKKKMEHQEWKWRKSREQSQNNLPSNGEIIRHYQNIRYSYLLCLYPNSATYEIRDPGENTLRSSPLSSISHSRDPSSWVCCED